MSGIAGVVSKKDCVQTLFYATDYHSHLGTEYGGMAVLGENGFVRRIHNISESQFKSKFSEGNGGMRGSKGIGVISDSDEQPIYLNSKFGPFCVVAMGLIENKDELKEILFKKGVSFSEVTKGGINVSELIAKLICLGDNLIDGIEKMFDVIKGSCSLLLLNEEGVFAARDRYGYTPLVLGKNDNEWLVACETTSFPNLGFKVVKFLAPGEIVLLTENGPVDKRAGGLINQICSFYWIYTGFPASTYEGINTEVVRERCGRALARQDTDIDPDLVTGVPDSGIAHAIGYSMESGKPYRRALVKYTPGYGRSYTPPTQKKRDLIATMKLIPVADIIRNNKIVVCDDSIVRGTQLKNFAIKKLWDAGAKEVHARPACPPLMFPCRFCLSTRTHSELIARKAIKAIEGRDLDDVSEYLDHKSSKYKKMMDWIVKDMGVTTLRYQKIEDMIEAIGLPKEKICLYCWNGKCPK
ncbi:MAG: amidophosphoribosyltransferase [Candidatus Omnitrophica bacterium]|nr:amidophosphoribosyltransferase [Candidatus Omnitrophota bacterium]